MTMCFVCFYTPTGKGAGFDPENRASVVSNNAWLPNNSPLPEVS
jgi:hypothetical protein